MEKKDIREIEKKEKQALRREAESIETRLMNKKTLAENDRIELAEYIFEIGMFSLTKIAFQTGRISEYQYYRLKMEQTRNELLKVICQKMEGLSEYDPEID